MVNNTLAVSFMHFMAIKIVLGFAKERSIPTLYKYTLRRWAKRNIYSLNENAGGKSGTVNLFVDEFTNYNDVGLGIKTIKLL